MATVVQDFGQPKSEIIFDGSSEEDVAHAKAFWQTINLLPPMESRLVSSDIKQRLKKAPSGKAIDVKPLQGITTTEDFLLKVAEEERMDGILVLEKRTVKREQHINLLQKHRAERIKKEKLSRNKGAPSVFNEEETLSCGTNDAEECLKDIEEFDRKHDTFSDSD